MAIDDPYELADLLYLMRRLRDPDGGCPWDIEQTFESIAPHTLEEAYEVVDCIERGDHKHLREELGDLLFQVVYHSQMASERGEFTFAEVVDGLTAKLISRHPHVFPLGNLYADTPSDTQDGERVRSAWEERKAEERAAKGEADRSALADIPVALPGLSRLQKLQKRAVRAGLKKPDSTVVLDDIARRLAEMHETLAAGGSLSDAQLGGLLFDSVELARQADVDAERAARGAAREFEQIFRALESTLEAQQEVLESLDVDDQRLYWRQVQQESP